jgi:hypothetical protein
LGHHPLHPPPPNLTFSYYHSTDSLLPYPLRLMLKSHVTMATTQTEVKVQLPAGSVQLMKCGVWS